MKKKEDIISVVNEPAVRFQKAQSGITKSDFLAVVAMTGLNPLYALENLFRS